MLCFSSCLVDISNLSFCSLNEVEQCTANTSWFTFKKENNRIKPQSANGSKYVKIKRNKT